MDRVKTNVTHPSWLRQREFGEKMPLGYSDRFHKGLYSAMYPYHSWDKGGHVRSAVHGGILNMEFSPDGTFLVAACEKHSILLFDPISHKLIRAINNAHRNCVTNVKFVDSWNFATGSDDSTVALWDVRNLKSHLRHLQGHLHSVQDIQYSSHNGMLVTSGFDGSVSTWDINRYLEEEDICKKVFYTYDLMRMRLNPDASKMIISTARGYLMIIHDLDLESLVEDLNEFQPDVYRMHLSQTAPTATGVVLFSRRKRNTVELVTDFPREDDTSVISSLEIHPQGWGALTRSTSEVKGLEWTCVHDIQDHEFGEEDSDFESDSDSDSDGDFLLPSPRGVATRGAVGVREWMERTEGAAGPSSAGDPGALPVAGPSGAGASLGLASLGASRRRDRERGRGMEWHDDGADGDDEMTAWEDDDLESLGNTSLDVFMHSSEDSGAENEFGNSREGIIGSRSDSLDIFDDTLPTPEGMSLINDPDGESSNESSNASDDSSDGPVEFDNTHGRRRFFLPPASARSVGEDQQTAGAADLWEGFEASGASASGPARAGGPEMSAAASGSLGPFMDIDERIRMLRSASGFVPFNGPNASVGFPRHFPVRPRLRRRIHKYFPRLTHFIEEPNAGKWYIKELCFSPDGRLICSPFGCGVRLLAFSPECSELSTCVPRRNPFPFYEMATNICHNSVVLCTKFSPRSPFMLVSGCFSGNVVWHQPVL